MSKSKITLKRRGGRPDWVFTPTDDNCYVQHTTRHGTLYSLMVHPFFGIQVVRYFGEHNAYIDWTKKVYADRLLFPGGGEYKFPR